MSANQFHSISLVHPDGAQRRNGESTYARLTIDRSLKSGKVDDVPLDEKQLIRIIEQAAHALRILRGNLSG